MDDVLGRLGRAVVRLAAALALVAGMVLVFAPRGLAALSPCYNPTIRGAMVRYSKSVVLSVGPSLAGQTFTASLQRVASVGSYDWRTIATAAATASSSGMVTLTFAPTSPGARAQKIDGSYDSF